MAIAEKAADAFGGPVGRGGAGGIGKAGRIDADRIGGDAGHRAEDAHTAVRGLLAPAMIDEVAHEVRAVVRGLEADDVIGAQGAGEPVVFRDGAEDLRRREGDVQEEARRTAPAGMAQGLAHQEEVVVVDPYRVGGFEPGGDEVGQALVDGGIGLERLAVERSQVESVVKDRPDHPVGVVEIEALMLVMGEVGEHEFHTLVAKHIGAARCLLDQAATPAEPAAAGLLQGFPDRNREPAGAGLGVCGRAI